MKTIVLLAGLMMVVYKAPAQKIAPVSSGQITGVSQNVHAGAGSVARGPGGEKAGPGGFSLSEGKARVVSGRVAGYGARAATGQRESASGGLSGSSFNSSRDFPATDFVATMPGPVLGSLSASAPASNFGVTLSAGAVHSRSSSAYHSTSHRLRTGNAILNPFSHSQPGSLPTGVGMPTVPGSGIH